MKIGIFMAILFASWVLIPEGFIRSLIAGHINGDGENAMDSFEFTVILLKAVFSVLLAFTGIWLYHKAK
ncbi:hypothetical protein FJW00_14775 [Pantoea anthophila]|uniref:Uncharacterized protein n=1 Tax=Pantoea anthophila TaxID=470931 RepID=A0ABY2Z6D2_9GAMM|nr:hypothetical protein FJW00_14775 [Pantoea anthophila]